MEELLSQIFNVKPFVLWLIVVMSGICGFVMRQLLPDSALSYIYVPGFIVGALVSNYLFFRFSILVATEKEANIVAATGFGISVALLVMLGLTRLLMSLDFNKPVRKSDDYKD